MGGPDGRRPDRRRCRVLVHHRANRGYHQVHVSHRHAGDARKEFLFRRTHGHGQDGVHQAARRQRHRQRAVQLHVHELLRADVREHDPGHRGR